MAPAPKPTRKPPDLGAVRCLYISRLTRFLHPGSVSRSGPELRETPQRKSRVVEISSLGSGRAQVGNHPGYSTSRGRS